MMDELFYCPCCGYRGLDVLPYSNLDASSRLIRHILPPYEIHFGLPSYEVCSCCGFEFGNDDNPGTSQPQSFEDYFAEWQASGCVWFDEEKKPEGWSLARQLDSL